jgi:hypothetical protein
MGLSSYRDEPLAFFRPEVIRISLWLVLAMWLARQFCRLLLWIIRAPAAAAAIASARRPGSAGTWSTRRCRSASLAGWWSGWWCGGCGGR